MKITDLEIQRFGQWQDLRISHVSAGLTVFYGPNEAGKTTLLHYIRSILYGHTPSAGHRYLEPAGPGEPSSGRPANGGSLYLSHSGSAYVVQRTFSAKEPSDDGGELRVLAADGARQGTDRLASMLQGVDEATFRTVFAIGLSELQHLATLDHSAAAQYLYQLSTGTNHVSLSHVMRHLRKKRDTTGSWADPTSGWQQLQGQEQKLVAEVKQHTASQGRWKTLMADRDAVNGEVSQLEARRRQLQDDVYWDESWQRVRPVWEQLQRVRYDLHEPGTVDEPPAALRRQWDALTEQIAEAEAHRQLLQERCDTHRHEVRQHAVDPKIWRQSARISALLEQRSWIAGLVLQRNQLEQQLKEQSPQVAKKNLLAGESTPTLTRAMLLSLRKSARHYALSRRRADSLQARVPPAPQPTAQLGGLDQVQQIMSDAGSPPPPKGGWDVVSAVETTAQLVANLRQRLRLEDDVPQTQSQLRDYDRAYRQLMDRQILSPHVLFGVGAIFSVGILLLLVALFGKTFGLAPNSRQLLGMIGAVFTMAAIFMKWSLHHSIDEQLEQCARQRGLAHDQWKRLSQEQKRLDELLPAGGGPMAQRLSTAENRLSQLESLWSELERPEDPEPNFERLTARAAAATRAMHRAQRRWQATLRACQLSDQLTPDDLKSLVTAYQERVRDRRLHVRLRNEFQHRNRELMGVRKRIMHLVRDMRLKTEDQDPVRLLDLLGRSLQQQDQIVEQRKSLRSQLQQLRHELQEATRTWQQLRQQQQDLLREQNWVDLQPLQQWEERYARHQLLQQQENEALDEIVRLQGTDDDQRSLLEKLQAQSQRNLAELGTKARTEIIRIEERLKQLHQRQGELQQQILALTTDRRLPEARLRLAALRQRMQKQVTDWHVYQTSSLLLQDVYKKFEQNRQPEALQEASALLKQLTGGRYPRIWTPMDEDRLLVDDLEGRAWQVEELSRGTREQVFLALRLSLIAGYARRGVRLPIVLDDVLVNFDTVRSRRATRVLTEFAEQGHQMLVFTCHEHIRHDFRQLGADVRDLPVADRDGDTPPLVSNIEPRRRRKRKKNKIRRTATAPAPMTVGTVIIGQPRPATFLQEQPVEPARAELVPTIINGTSSLNRTPTLYGDDIPPGQTHSLISTTNAESPDDERELDMPSASYRDELPPAQRSRAYQEPAHALEDTNRDTPTLHSSQPSLVNHEYSLAEDARYRAWHAAPTHPNSPHTHPS